MIDEVVGFCYRTTFKDIHYIVVFYRTVEPFDCISYEDDIETRIKKIKVYGR